MKRLAQFLLVVLFPIALITVVGVLALYLDRVTTIDFYTVSEHPITWVVSLIVVTIAYMLAD